jgi:hypothetical protein
VHDSSGISSNRIPIEGNVLRIVFIFLISPHYD